MKWVQIFFLKNHKLFLTQIESGYLMSGFCVSENKLKEMDVYKKNKQRSGNVRRDDGKTCEWASVGIQGRSQELAGELCTSE